MQNPGTSYKVMLFIVPPLVDRFRFKNYFVEHSVADQFFIL